MLPFRGVPRRIHIYSSIYIQKGEDIIRNYVIKRILLGIVLVYRSILPGIQFDVHDAG